jgi:DNA-binding NarL/FixJ family response regulator
LLCDTDHIIPATKRISIVTENIMNREECIKSIRVLVVEDSVAFRHVVCSILRERRDLEIISQVSDGLEAVQNAEELQPDLILLDIGLPTLNGIEAALRIRRVSPMSRIIFVSQESSADVIEGALSVGAMGYVIKTHAKRELLNAVRTVLEANKVWVCQPHLEIAR